MNASLIDVRGPRFAAWITTFVLAVALVSQSGVLLLGQAVIFALGAFGVPPYGIAFRTLIQPRLAAPTEFEDSRPPQFAQAVGLVFAAGGAIALLAGATGLGLVLTGAALAAAFLNAAFGVCLGCEIYLIVKRATTKGVPA